VEHLGHPFAAYDLEPEAQAAILALVFADAKRETPKDADPLAVIDQWRGR
jgi:hypothetical protein